MNVQTNRNIIITMLITFLLMLVLSITMYSSIAVPQFYSVFLDTGIKYLNEEKYEEAILVFNKIMKVERKSTEARVYLAKGYIGNEEIDKAITSLEEAQNLDKRNENLLLEILNILNTTNSDIAYDFLYRYVDEVGKDNLSDKVQEILDTAEKSPTIPSVSPVPNIYIKPVQVKLVIDEIKIGHSYYYTLDKSEPTRESSKYSKYIEVDKDTTINLIGFNKKGESTEVLTLEYIIDKEILGDIKDLLIESRKLIENIKIGIEVGNTTDEVKRELENVVVIASKQIDSEYMTYEKASEVKKKLEEAIEEFKDNIIEPTDRSKLKAMIEEARKIYDTSVEGKNEGQYKVGSRKILLDGINKAIKVENYILSKQAEIDNEVKEIKRCISIFKEKKIVLFTEQVAINILKREITDEVEKQKVEEFSNSKFIVKYWLEVLDQGTENGKKYYDISDCMEISLPNGESWYDEMYDEYIESATFGTVYRIYQDSSIEAIEHWN